MSLNITSNLIALERGSDELLLANSFHMRPLYVARGRERVRQLLANMPSGLSLDDLKATSGRDASLVDLLREYRILVDTENEMERFNADQIAQQAAIRRRRDRLTAYVLLTEACNLNCIYCLNGEHTYHRNGRSLMTSETALASVVRCLDQLDQGGHLEVAFFGGEPLLNWRLLKEVIEQCETELKPRYSDKKITYHLTSNLTISPPDLVDVVLKHRIPVMCDVDGPPEIHDRCRPYRSGRPSHARTAKTIRRLVEAGTPVALRATVTALNEDHIFEIAAHHKELGVAHSAFVPVSPIDSDGEFLPEEMLPDLDKLVVNLAALYRSGMWDKDKLFPFNQYVQQLRPGSRQITACAAPSGTTPVIRVDGDVYLCIYLVGQEKFRYGNLAGPWDDAMLDDLTRRLHVDNMDRCRACPWRYSCGGGCPVTSLVEQDVPPEHANALAYGRRLACDFNRAILAELLWDMADQVAAGTAVEQRSQRIRETVSAC